MPFLGNWSTPPTGLHIAEGQTKGLDNFGFILAVVSGTSINQKVNLTVTSGNGLIINSAEKMTANVLSGTAERSATVRMTSAANSTLSMNFAVTVLDETKGYYFDNYYVEGGFSDYEIESITTAIAFVDMAYFKQFGVSFASSGDAVPDSVTSISQCSSLEGPCSSACGSNCDNHHKNLALISDQLYSGYARETNHLCVLWSNLPDTYCTNEIAGYGHTVSDALGVVYYNRPVIHIVELVDKFHKYDNSDPPVEPSKHLLVASMAILLAHETAHSFGQWEAYDDPEHDADESWRCVMEMYDSHEAILPLSFVTTYYLTLLMHFVVPATNPWRILSTGKCSIAIPRKNNARSKKI